MKQLFYKKDEVNLEDLMFLTPAMLYLHTQFVLYCNTEFGISPTITSVRDKVEGRVSDSHAHGRAVDYSSKLFSEAEREKVLKHFNKKYKSIAALSYSDGKPRALIYHRGPNGVPHFHLQTRWIDYPELKDIINKLENKKTTKFLACLRK